MVVAEGAAAAGMVAEAVAALTAAEDGVASAAEMVDAVCPSYLFIEICLADLAGAMLGSMLRHLMHN